MAKISRQVGTTSQITELFAQNSAATNGAGLTGLAYNTNGMTCYYKRNTGSGSVAVTLDNITTLGTYEPTNGAHGALAVVDGANMIGVYEFQLPNNALNSGADSVVFCLQGAANMAPVLLEIELTAINSQSTGFGLLNASANVVQVNGAAVNTNAASSFTIGA